MSIYNWIDDKGYEEGTREDYEAFERKRNRPMMNEKIKQFAELSKAYKTILVDGQMQSVLLIDPERFANMILFECIKIAVFNGDKETAKGIKEWFEWSEK